MGESSYSVLPEIIATYWPVLVVSLGVSLALTPICRRVALSLGVVDRPDNWLKPHAKPIPYLGGIAIFAGWGAGIVCALLVLRDVINPMQTIGGSASVYVSTLIVVLVAGLLVTLLGLADDLWSLSPRLKLVCNIAIALLLVWFGVGDDIGWVVSGSVRVRFEAHAGWLVAAYVVPVSIFVIVGACNAANLIDGLDGLCSGVLGISAIGFLVLAVHLHSNWAPRDAQRVVLSLALAGACFGFLPYNRHPARVFMGDAGSMLLGLNAAVLILLFAEEQGIKWLMGAVMVFGLPVVDMGLAILRRWRAQQPLMQGDRSHFYDQLVDRGLSVRAVVRISYALAGTFALMGILPTFMHTRHVILVYAVFMALVVYGLHRLRMVRVDTPPAHMQTPPGGCTEADFKRATDAL